MERRKFTREFKLEAVRLIKERGVSYAQASRDLSVHQSQLRSWVKELADDPQHAFPGKGQMKPEQLEIAQLKREVIKLKAERDIVNAPPPKGGGFELRLKAGLVRLWRTQLTFKSSSGSGGVWFLI
jgi:transposase-like protein